MVEKNRKSSKKREILHSILKTNNISTNKREELKSLEDNARISERLEYLTQHSLDNENYFASVRNCRQLLEINPKNSTKHIEVKQQFEKLCKDLKTENSKKYAEELEIKENIQKLEQIVNIEQDIAPEIETLTLSELEVSNRELNDMFEMANDLLESRGVELIHHVESSATFVTKQGAAVPSKVVSHVGRDFNTLKDQQFSNDDSDALKFDRVAEINYDLASFADDPIEEAFLEDIIPYNYEVKEIEINGKLTKKEPQKHLTKEGLQLGWHFTHLEKRKSINVKYHLRPRVSRTLVLPRNNEVDIIRTHSNLKDPTNDKDSYFTYLSFNNQYREELKRVVMEDIIPQSYLYHVEEKKSGFFPSSKESSEGYVKWRISNVPQAESTEHEYELIEINTIEDMKIEAFNLLQIDLSKLSPATCQLIKKKQQDARKFLAKFEETN